MYLQACTCVFCGYWNHFKILCRHLPTEMFYAQNNIKSSCIVFPPPPPPPENIHVFSIDFYSIDTRSGLPAQR